MDGLLFFIENLVFGAKGGKGEEEEGKSKTAHEDEKSETEKKKTGKRKLGGFSHRKFALWVLHLIQVIP